MSYSVWRCVVKIIGLISVSTDQAEEREEAKETPQDKLAFDKGREDTAAGRHASVARAGKAERGERDRGNGVSGAAGQGRRMRGEGIRGRGAAEVIVGRSEDGTTKWTSLERENGVQIILQFYNQI